MFEKTVSVASKRKKSRSKTRNRQKVEQKSMDFRFSEFSTMTIRKASISVILVHQIFTYDLHLSIYKFQQWNKSYYPIREMAHSEKCNGNCNYNFYLEVIIIVIVKKNEQLHVFGLLNKLPLLLILSHHGSLV